MTIGKSLLATTALVACVTAASAGQKLDRPIGGFVPRWMNLGVPGHVVNGFPVTVMPGTARPALVREDWLPKYRNAIFDNINWRYKNTNAAWISWYGYSFLNDQSCYDYSSNYHYCISETGNNGAAFEGTGKKATKIGVPIFRETASTTANVGIYSATASSLPGQELAGGSCTESASGLCWVDANIFLKKGQKYFVEVSCAAGQSFCYGGAWDMENTDFSGDEIDYWHAKEHITEYYYGSQYSYTFSSPWHESTFYPTEGAFIIL